MLNEAGVGPLLPIYLPCLSPSVWNGTLNKYFMRAFFYFLEGNSPTRGDFSGIPGNGTEALEACMGRAINK